MLWKLAITHGKIGISIVQTVLLVIYIGPDTHMYNRYASILAHVCLNVVLDKNTIGGKIHCTLYIDDRIYRVPTSKYVIGNMLANLF